LRSHQRCKVRTFTTETLRTWLSGGGRSQRHHKTLTLLPLWLSFSPLVSSPNLHAGWLDFIYIGRRRALFRRNVSRLSTASSNASLSPPIRPRTLLAATYPRHIGSAPRTRESSSSMYSRKQNQIGRVGDLGACVRLFVFPNPPYTASRKMSITRTAGACTSL
jgi:hypothetical protein